MTHNQIASYMEAHREPANTFEDVAPKSYIRYTDKGVPTHLTNIKVADALCNLSDTAGRIVLDSMVVHPRSGSTDDAKWNKNAFANIKFATSGNAVVNRRHFLSLAFAAEGAWGRP